MTKKNRDKLDKRLSLQPPEYINRKPRSVQERGFYKASEYRNLLLYFLPYALRGLLDESKVKHFQLLSAATYILLQSELNENEINQAGEMFTTFADRFEEMYGKETVTMNVHILRHYAETVKNCGPIWVLLLKQLKTQLILWQQFHSIIVWIELNRLQQIMKFE